MTNKNNETSSTIDAVAKLTESIPIYQDLVQPAAKELGRSLETASKLINTALMPVRGLVWGFEEIETYLASSLTKKLSATKGEDISSPPINIAGPVFESLRFNSEEENLKNMFTNLLANSMDNQSKHLAHPAYVEIIKNLSGDEAKILDYFSNLVKVKSIPVIDQIAKFESTNGQTIVFRNTTTLGNQAKCNSPALTPNYIDNLVRLGLLYIRDGAMVKKDIYSDIESSEHYLNNISFINNYNNYLSDKVSYIANKKSILLTDFGKTLIIICVKDKNV